MRLRITLPARPGKGRGRRRSPKWAKPVRRWASRQTPGFLAAAGALSVAVVGLGLWAAWFAYTVASAIPDTAALRGIGSMAQATTLFDRADRPAFTIFQEQRIEVPLDRVSPHLVSAIVAVEDQRFFDHRGVDVVRVAGAAVSNLRAGRRAQGGSTITQQLARQSFLTPEKTFRRKITEALVAARLERQFTKHEILELYLNKVYFGDGLYGVEAASLGYFGKPAADLGVAESALLAGLVQSPSAYAPTANLEKATARRNLVLRVMLEAGVIDEPTYEAALDEPVTIEDGLRRAEGAGQYYEEEVRRLLVERFGWERVYTEGLKVYTTIDVDLQKSAEAELARALAEIEQQQGRRRAQEGDDPLQAALIAMDPATGEVRALVGGRDFSASSFNRATQARRQPGSAFKPFVYAAALELGYAPTTVIANLDDPVMTPQGDWVPEDGHDEETALTMRAALRVSSNRAAVRMLEQIGIPVAVDYARRLGVGEVPAVPSLALGSGEVTLSAMTAAYAAFANGGLVPTPVLVRRVETAQGEVLYDEMPEPRRAISEGTAYVMADMLADVLDAGTGAAVRRAGFTRPAAGKTGTTNDYHDAWLVGFTPRLATGVWVGYDRPRTIADGGYASQLAAPLWGRFMRIATRTQGSPWLAAPEGVRTARICPLSGALANEGCLDAYEEHFHAGGEPTEYCPIHRRPVLGGALRALAGLVVPPGRRVSSQRVEPARPTERADRAAASTGASAQPLPEEPPAPRRRGFWSRVFGGSRDRR